MVPANAIGASDDPWHSDVETGERWIQLNLGAEYEIDKVIILLPQVGWQRSWLSDVRNKFKYTKTNISNLNFLD